jgi:ubiquinone/menaquinone biosynthesis C-methylase UbiE
MNSEDLRAYHKTITDTYDERSANHDKSDWHRHAALRLVEGLPPRPGDRVLDIATGTGTIAFQAASLVGDDGRVVGVDLSEGMLAQANVKLATSGLRNLAFILADAENLAFPPNSFDRLYCASAFFCILDPVATLRHWRDLLKPGGCLGFHGLPDTCCVWVSVARRVLENYGIPYVLNAPTGTIEKCRRLLADAGFKAIDIREEKLGRYIPLDEAKKGWLEKEHFAPGQHPHPLANVSPEIVAQAQRDYEAALDALNTDKGVWNDLTMYHIYGEK